VSEGTRELADREVMFMLVMLPPVNELGQAGRRGSSSMKGILFLCVANSARSQMAEGIARTFAPAGVKVYSAGSRPSSVRPEAITVLQEIGIDISHQLSKPVSSIPAAEVDTVVPLCAEEECPLFLGQATRFHWGLFDPAQATGSAADQMEAFRRTRDELLRRLETFFAAPPRREPAC
jgi:protein-tyrosine-phosphatase